MNSKQPGVERPKTGAMHASQVARLSGRLVTLKMGQRKIGLCCHSEQQLGQWSNMSFLCGSRELLPAAATCLEAELYSVWTWVFGRTARASVQGRNVSGRVLWGAFESPLPMCRHLCSSPWPRAALPGLVFGTPGSVGPHPSLRCTPDGGRARGPPVRFSSDRPLEVEGAKQSAPGDQSRSATVRPSTTAIGNVS